MKQYAGALFVLVSLGAVAAIGAGCDNASNNSGGSAGAPVGTAGAPVGTAGAPVGTAGTASSAAGAGTSSSDVLPTGATEVPLTPSMTGFVDSTATGVQGAWYSYGDGNEGAMPAGVCQTTGMHMTSECSVITAPAPGLPFAPAGTSMAQMCTNGTVAKVIPAAKPDYSNIFGAGIGLDLNNPGLDGGTGKKMPYNAKTHNVIGISFDLSAVPASGLRVEFPFSAPDAAIWKPSKAGSYTSPLSVGHNILLFTNVVPPPYVAAAAQVPFDPATLLSLQFHIPTTTSSSAPYSFCLDNVSLIVQM
jgi:hypothetical protein